MLSNKPYLLRAFHEWIVDSGCKPVLVVDASHPRCKVPLDLVENNEILFNVSPMAVRDLKLSNEAVEFKASFSGVIHVIYVPIKAVTSIYAEENNEGIVFDPEENAEQESVVVPLRAIDGSVSEASEGTTTTTTTSSSSSSSAKPILRLVE